MEAASTMLNNNNNQRQSRTIVSEEIFLALRPRHNFSFDERNPVSVAPGLIGYVLVENGHVVNQQRWHANQSTGVGGGEASQNRGGASNINVPQTQVVLPIARCSPQRMVVEQVEQNSESGSATDFDDVAEDQPFDGEECDNSNTQSTTIPNVEKSQCSLVLPGDLQALANDCRINGFHRQANANAGASAGGDAIGECNPGNRNPLVMFGSMNSSFSSEMYSIDVSVETDSEMEWITPEMIANNSDYRSNYAPILPTKHIVRNNNRRKQSGGHQPGGSSVPYKGDRARQYSDFSESERAPGPGNFSSRVKRKRFRPSLSRNGPKLPSWLSSRSSFNSELSIPPSQAGSVSALDRLNSAARRVDKMLQELAVVDGCNSSLLPDCAPFPTAAPNGMDGSHLVPPPTKSMQKRPPSTSKREMSSNCQTEYDNAESEDEDGACSDSGMVNPIRLEHTRGRLEELKLALMGSKTSRDNQHFSNTRPPNIGQLRFPRHIQPRSRPQEVGGGGRPNSIAIPLPDVNLNDNEIDNGDGNLANCSSRRFDNGSEADIESCSSVASSSMVFDKLRWKSVHSIGYDNEYEFESDNEDEIDIHSSAATELSDILKQEEGAFVPQTNGARIDIPPMDDDDEDEQHNRGTDGFRPYKSVGSQRSAHPEKDKAGQNILDARGEVVKLSQDIRRNFGDYQLASFSDIEK